MRKIGAKIGLQGVGLRAPEGLADDRLRDAMAQQGSGQVVPEQMNALAIPGGLDKAGIRLLSGLTASEKIRSQSEVPSSIARPAPFFIHRGAPNPGHGRLLTKYNWMRQSRGGPPGCARRTDSGAHDGVGADET